MRTGILFLGLFVIFAVTSEACGSDCVAGDLDRLLEVAGANDPGRNLDWADTRPPGHWTGVRWKGLSGTLRVTALDVVGKGLTGTLNPNDLDRLSVLYADDNRLTALDASRNASLRTLASGRNRLRTLDVGRNASLVGLWVDGNRLMTALDVGSNKSLEWLDVSGSRIPSSVLFAFMGIGNLNLGTQTGVALSAFTSEPVPGTACSLASEAVLGGRATVFTLEKDGKAAVERSEFTMDAAGLLTFLDRGEFRITMWNSAAHDQDESPLGTPYGDGQATVISSVPDVRPAGSPVRRNGGPADARLPSGSGPVGEDRPRSGSGARHLETDGAVSGPSGARVGRIGPAEVRPDGMKAETCGDAFCGDPADGRAPGLSASSGTAAGIPDRTGSSPGATVGVGGRLAPDGGFAASAIPAVEASGDPRAVSARSVNGAAAGFSGADLSRMPPTAKPAKRCLRPQTGPCLTTPPGWGKPSAPGADLAPDGAALLPDAA
ncbi:MAG: hypothetical protein LBQ79_02035 [Deltaproteobacteria bacterium]|jgi:hypothetical protein|nr:hypothetical protein [Deltaproteobacteria bacterium]